MNKTGLMAKISIKYVLPTSIWKYLWQILRYFTFLGEFRGILGKYLNFAGPRPCKISEALLSLLFLFPLPANEIVGDKISLGAFSNETDWSQEKIERVRI